MLQVIGLGDSLMHFNSYDTYPQTGWFQVLDRFVKDPQEVRFLDFALNGRSTKSFIDEGQFEKSLSKAKKGDIVLISFGHNDEKIQDPSRYTAPYEGYLNNLKKFYEAFSKIGCTVCFLTSIARLKYGEDGKLMQTHGEYIQAMKDAARECGAYLIDLNKLSTEYFNRADFDANKKFIMTLEKGQYENYPNGNDDTTHLTMLGALKICELILPELKKIPELDKILL